MHARLTRRDSLLAAGGLLVAAAVGGCGGSDSGPASAGADCVLAPEQTEGPYYVPGEKLRRHIAEGRPGAPLALALSVVDASSCKPVRGAAVDVWHCDALGVYSGVQGGGGTFMRGVQRTDAKGVARFDTVYPGWYVGRAVHIHVKVHVGGDVVHTGQLYFADSLTDAVYRGAPYDRRPDRDTRNAGDPIYNDGGSTSTLRVRRAGPNGYIGSIAMGVRA